MNRLLLFAVVIFFGACRNISGSGNIEKQTRQTNSFNAINVGGDFEVEISQGPQNVVVEADDNIINEIETHVNDGELKIRLRDIDVSDAHMRIMISTPDIRAIKSSASANIEAKDLRSGKLLLDASSGSVIHAAVDAPEMKLETSSGGELTVSGRTKNIHADASSGGTIDAKSLLSEHTNAQASSGGTVRIHASVSLDAKANSGGVIKYTGNPSVTQNTGSGGEVEKQ